MKTLVIPNSVIKIEGDAYRDRTDIDSVVIPDSVTKIEFSAFRCCEGLQSVFIPNSVTEIGANAFRSCSELKFVVIPDSVTKIGPSAFRGCSGLKYVVISGSVTEIENNTFRGCRSLEHIVIPNSVKKIGNKVFRGCNGLQSVVIPNSVTGIGEGAFSFCSCLKTVDIPNSVTEIGDRAFCACTNLQSVVIPNSVAEINACTFAGCRKLSSVFIPASVSKINYLAFVECNSLNSIVVDKTNPVFDSRCNCNAIIHTKTNTLLMGCTNTIIPDSVERIGEAAFIYGSIKSVVIPDSVVRIDWCAFGWCSNLKSVIIPDSVQEIESCAFCDCSSLEFVSISNSVEGIGNSTFEGCSGLKYIVIPRHVKKIGDSAFAGCTSLRSVDIPDSVIWMGNSVFKFCDNLQSVYVPASWNNFENLGCPPEIIYKKRNTRYDKLMGIVDALRLLAEKREFGSSKSNTKSSDKAIVMADSLSVNKQSLDISYASLKALRDAGQLVPGHWYRITDYQCTTLQIDTESANHVFDIIVRADDASHLNENAFAAHHEGDTYFQYSTLEAWQLKYCLDNDTSRFVWADPDGTGVIYRMIDEWDNDLPYDFKNMLFKRVKVSGEWVKKAYENADFLYIGIPDALPEEFEVDDENDTLMVYTFNGIDDPDDVKNVCDMSIRKEIKTDDYEEVVIEAHHPSKCRVEAAFGKVSNDIARNDLRYLNNIVFVQMFVASKEFNVSGSVFQAGCYDITIGMEDNSGLDFGIGCSEITLGVDCEDCHFGFGCQNIRFGNYCSENDVGHSSENITLGTYCLSNKLGPNCEDTSFESDCFENTLGSCSGVRFGYDCWCNTLVSCYDFEMGNCCHQIVADNSRKCIVKGGSSVNSHVKNAHILSGTIGKGPGENRLEICFAENKSFTQYAGLNSRGELRVWIPADLVPL